MLKTVVLYWSSKFQSASQVVMGSEASVSLDGMSKFGLMSRLDECSRTVICDETDMVYADVGLFLSSNAFRASTKMNRPSGVY